MIQKAFLQTSVLWLDICNKIVGVLLSFLFTNDFLTLTYISVCKTHDQYGSIVMRFLLTNETYSILLLPNGPKNLAWRFLRICIFKFIHVLLKNLCSVKIFL